jgi:translation initiation factor 1
MERSGRGGKDVTIVAQLDLTTPEREQWLKALKASLGCGGTLDGDDLVLQGDHRRRLQDLLAARGVRKVIVG